MAVSLKVPSPMSGPSMSVAPGTMIPCFKVPATTVPTPGTLHCTPTQGTSVSSIHTVSNTKGLHDILAVQRT